MTTNPRWEEIERELLPGQTTYDRSDLVARVFEMKKNAVLDYIYKHGVFGSVVAYVNFRNAACPTCIASSFFETLTSS